MKMDEAWRFFLLPELNEGIKILDEIVDTTPNPITMYMRLTEGTMLSKTYLAGVFLAASSVAFASTAIGTASTRGGIRVDGYAINGNATLFEGSTVETSQTTATLRLQKGTQIKLGTDSEGMLFSDHLNLVQGNGEVSAAGSFEVDASGFHVISKEPNTRGVVAVSGAGKIAVSAAAGEFEVTDDAGNALGNVVTGKAMSFALPGEQIAIEGTVSGSNGKYYLTDKQGKQYELQGKGLGKFVNKMVRVTGAANADGSVFTVSTIAVLGTVIGSSAGLLGATIVVVAAGAAIFSVQEGIYQAGGASR
jgi:hypothetical protein